jgi:solute carrier family 35 (UDP-xylose/UDP-N-acetylglucosamine transporter), member B4
VFRYNRYQVISCLLITAGVIVATFADSIVQIGCCGNDDIRSSTNTSRSLESGLFTWFIGVSLLTISLVLSSILGHWQESGYRKYGRYPQENMFYSHVFALPVFLLLAPDIATRLPALISQPSPFSIPVIDTPLSYSAIMVINLLSQYVCVRGVYDITCLSTTLTCTFTITIRKFLSLLISGIFMGNNLTLLHWAGAGLVFIGTVLYSTPRGVQNAIPHRKIQ